MLGRLHLVHIRARDRPALVGMIVAQPKRSTMVSVPAPTIEKKKYALVEGKTETAAPLPPIFAAFFVELRPPQQAADDRTAQTNVVHKAVLATLVRGIE